MAVLRIEKNSDFTIMPNYPFRDMRLSFKGRGLLGTMLTLRDDWDYTLAGLTAISPAWQELRLQRPQRAGTARVSRTPPAPRRAGALHRHRVRHLRGAAFHSAAGGNTGNRKSGNGCADSGKPAAIKY